MSKKPIDIDDEGMRDEYDFSHGVRGKYAGRFERGTNLVKLDEDVARVFPDSDTVNRALRAVIEIARSIKSANPKKEKRSA